MARGTKLCYIYVDEDGTIHYIYARNLAEAQRKAPQGETVERYFYQGS